MFLYVISAYDSSKPRVENMIRHNILTKRMTQNNLTYLEIQGVYKGVQEESVIIKSNREDAKKLGSVMQQESILEINMDDLSGKLVFIDGAEDLYIGKMKMSADKPKGDHSHIFETSTYFHFV